ncbi:HTH-type transcriptional regulator RafR [Pseudoruegeria aquimaris]|uniref:HTH-type transcriptional regulator RafR n=1 Tax=Pseudoruegeria aquimaris TaxID=393663 RepID=A0A1Y5T7H2_9RHOB|nr:LacI family DNA-binding transcriptional regulator [Pseudoruegeria aquimaris]SLN57572.1 HTH-type transcriptional regulator RafR [Pseudoruegeria aquimaris]
MKPKPTLKTIAALSGYAVPTVSRALSDAPDIAESTRRKVQQIAREVGYMPNRGGLRLKTGKTFTIALVLGIGDRVSEHAGRLIASVANQLRPTAYSLIVTTYSEKEGDPLEAVKRVVENGLADAIIIEQIETRDARVRYMLDAGFPFAIYGRCAWPEPVASYDFDNAAFGAIAARALLEKGRRRILCVAPPRSQTYTAALLGGLGETLAPAGGTLDILEGVHGQTDTEAGRARLAQRLAEGDPPEGIVCCSTSDTLAVLRQLRRRGLVPGRDVDLFTKESYPMVRDFEPAVMSLTEDVEAAGRFLADAAVTVIERPEAPRPSFVDRP